jgi:hypothetical protein
MPTGLRLIMMGDSVTRFQYLSLAYFLRHGNWFDNPTEQNPKYAVNSHLYSTWTDFFNATTNTLAPMEYCDCFRDSTCHDRDIMENRYFYDKVHDNRVIFLTAFGRSMSIPMHGRWNSSTVMALLSGPWQGDVSVKGMTQSPSEAAYAWEFYDWKQTAEEHASAFGAKHLLFNAGLWPHNFQDSQTFLNFTGALNERGIQPIWKSTTYNINHRLLKVPRTKDQNIWRKFCEGRSNATWCIHLGWTRYLNRSNFGDLAHFLEPVYRVMNEELLELIGHTFPPTYVKQPKEVLFEGYKASNTTN